MLTLLIKHYVELCYFRKKHIIFDQQANKYLWLEIVYVRKKLQYFRTGAKALYWKNVDNISQQ